MVFARCILYLFCYLLVGYAFGQSKYENVRVNHNETVSKEIRRLINQSSSIKDSIDFDNYVNEFILNLYKSSYLEASIDSIVDQDTSIEMHVHFGKRYSWAYLDRGNVSEDALNYSGFRDKFYNNRPFKLGQFSRLIDDVLSYYENNGYPFARIRLDSVTVENGNFHGKLHVDKQKEIIIDSIKFIGDHRTNDKFLFQFIRLQPGDSYNERSIVNAEKNLAELPFLKKDQTFNVLFREEETIVKMFISKNKASTFNGIVGFLQNEEDGSFQITGDLKLQLYNSLKRGESFFLNYRGLPNKSQDLKMELLYPYLLNTPFGLDLGFNLYRRDTIFIDLILDVGLRYQFSAFNYFKVMYNSKTSSLLSTSQYSVFNQPTVFDYTQNLYGALFHWEKLDYRLNPRKGIQFEIEGAAGNKSIDVNQSIPVEIYDDVELKTLTVKGKNEFSWFIPVFRRSAILLANQSAFLENDQLLFNDMYRIGGLKKLRGFDEESIFASLYTINTFEYRFLFEKNSFVHLFFDWAYYQNNGSYLEENIQDDPMGFGAGVSFETVAGIFALSYALGQQFDNPVLFRTAKIHFGFTSVF